MELKIWEGRKIFEVREKLEGKEYSSAPNFNFCQIFDSMKFIKIL